MPTIPDTLEEALSPSWLTSALGTRFSGIDVVDVVPGPVVSRVSTNARFRIVCDGDLPAGLVPDLCVKGYFGEIGKLARRAGLPEARFYRDLAPATGVRTLPAVYIDLDADTLANVVVTEDVVAQGATFLDPLSHYTPDQTAASLEQLAVLHAGTWNDPTLAEASWLTPWFRDVGNTRGVDVIATNFASDLGEHVPEAARDADRLFRAYAIVAGDASEASPWCVVHGDAHVGNLFLDADGQPSLVDWQLVQRGPWYLDVGYHLASSLTVDDRRRTERDLIGVYLDRLRAGGVEPPGDDEVWRGLRRGFIHGFFLWGITQKVDRPIIAVLLERLGTAVDDHDAFAEVGV